LFAEGAVSPLDEVLDIAAAVELVRLLGWQWEFLPSLAAELVPGVDLIPFGTLALLMYIGNGNKVRQLVKFRNSRSL